MKQILTYVLFICLGLCIMDTTPSFAQSNAGEEYSQISLERAIQLIEQKYNVHFSFSSDLINLDKKINLNLNQKSLKEVIGQLANQANVDFRINDKQIILIPKKATRAERKNSYIYGYVRDIHSKEILPDILIYCSNNKTAVYTNTYGYYSIPVPNDADSVELQAHILGYKTNRKLIDLQENKLVNWDLESTITIESIEIQDQRMEDKAFHKSIISDNIDESIRALSPRILGEKDALAAARYYAGVNRETDISNGYNIRGGRSDQNLIVLDDAPLYHSFHLFGFYSIFNEEALKQMNLIKGGFPARYGGRLSSVVEMITKDGDLQKYHMDLGTGIIASRVGLEGPIVKDKLAFFVTGRSSHLKTLMKLAGQTDDLGYQFYDVNTKLQWKLNNKHKLFLTYYNGRDVFSGSEDGSGLVSNELGWGNQSSTLRWNHIISPKIFSNTTLYYTNYDFISDQSDSTITMRFSSRVRDYSLKYDLDYFHNERNHFKIGFIATHHIFVPTRATAIGLNSAEEFRDDFRMQEFAFYVEDEISLSDKFSANLGIRYSGFTYQSTLGFNPEPRALFTYILSKKYALKASYSRMFQYVHYLNSFAGIGLPNDLWLPSTDKLRPEKSDQYSLGIYFNNKKDLKLNVEAFYKFQKNILVYANNSSFLSSLIDPSNDGLNSTWEERTMDGLAEVYGVELQTEYQKSKYKALFSYTLSFSKNYFEELDYGKWFWANNDRRHNLSIMNSYAFTKKWSVIASWIFTTGTPFTLPESSYYLQGHEPGNLSGGSFFGSSQYFGYDFKGINNYRMSSYHRLDVTVNYHTKLKRALMEFQIGAMNVYNRRNSLYYTLGYDEKTMTNQLKRQVFMGIMPSLTLNFRF
jgi:hypothetical protein